jgi:deoxyribodipyrimidine photo-lyase
MKLTIFWFRRDLRLEDNVGLSKALQSGLNVVPIFIFDDFILKDLPKDDSRVYFIYNALADINVKLNAFGGSIKLYKGKPMEVWKKIVSEFDVDAVFFNKDYEPYALNRDNKVQDLLLKSGIKAFEYKDQVVFEENDIIKTDGKPYTVFTPYKKRWLIHLKNEPIQQQKPLDLSRFHPTLFPFPALDELGFKASSLKVRDYDLSVLDDYAEKRDIPAADATTHLGSHLRFGTVSIRKIVAQLNPSHEVFLSELIWREFFMQILFHFPKVVNNNFHSKYDGLNWLNREEDFEKWCNGKTGYPLVDAGMRQMNETGYMHNRVRLVTASFLCKHLLIDWRWGESYFAEKLLDYELSSNNGNWQWAAGTGCDAAPYFRIFNPLEQQKKFDRDFEYINRWIPEFVTTEYPQPMIDHKYARQRALNTYSKSLKE